MASSARIDELRKKFDENPRRYFAPLANEYRKAGDLEQAIFICQEYLPQQPGHMSGHIVYGQALFELSRFDEARAVFETALSLDPENLIALRHLGDIARQAGDLRGARVLVPARAGGRSAQRRDRADHADRADDAARFAARRRERCNADGRRVRPERPAASSRLRCREAMIAEFPVEKSEDGSGLAVGPELSQLAERQPEPEPIRRSPEAIPDDELLDLNDFSVGDVPLSSLVTAPARAARPRSRSSRRVRRSIRSRTDPGRRRLRRCRIERSEDALAFEADPYAIARGARDRRRERRAAAASARGVCHRHRLGLPDDGGAPSLSDAHDSPVLDGLESYSEPAFGLASAEPAPAMDVESFFATPTEAPLASETYEPLRSRLRSPRGRPPSMLRRIRPRRSSASASAEPVPEIEAHGHPDVASEAVEETGEAAFVTETMAELYLQQGHLEAALDIYQKLAEQRPGDESLRERMLAVADAIHDAAARHRSSLDAQPEAYASYDDGAMTRVEGSDEDAALVGPTIREFLAGILQPRSFVAAEDLIERELRRRSSTARVRREPRSTRRCSTRLISTEPIFGQATAPAFDDSVFDTSAYGDAPSFGETAMYPTPAFGLTPAYGGTAHAVHADTPTPDTASSRSRTRQSPTPDRRTPPPSRADVRRGALRGDDARDRSDSAEFASLGSTSRADGLPASIDEEFGADSNDWPQTGRWCRVGGRSAKRRRRAAERARRVRLRRP